MGESFFIADGQNFIPTPWCRGPWDPKFQHAGPPAALLGRSAEAFDGDAQWQVSRFAMDILKPIPLSPLQVTTSIRRSGRTTRLIEVYLRHGDVELARASVWQIRRGATEPQSPPLPHPLPANLDETAMIHLGWDPSYFTAVEGRYVQGSFFTPGPAVVWMRSRYPLVEGEETSGLSRLLIAADSANGVSSVTPLMTSIFINVELTVHLIGELHGEWVCLDAATTVGATGVGVARSTLWDEHGCVGFGSQSLLMGQRG